LSFFSFDLFDHMVLLEWSSEKENEQ
jgi:hypothetical protein